MLETICHFLCVMKKWVMINDSLDVTMASHVAFRANLEQELPYHHFETGSKTGSRASLLCNSWLPNKKRMVVTTNRDQIWVIKCPANWIYILCMTVILKICYVFFRYVISKQHKMSNLQNFYPKLSRFDIYFSNFVSLAVWIFDKLRNGDVIVDKKGMEIYSERIILLIRVRLYNNSLLIRFDCP